MIDYDSFTSIEGILQQGSIATEEDEREPTILIVKNKHQKNDGLDELTTSNNEVSLFILRKILSYLTRFDLGGGDDLPPSSLIKDLSPFLSKSLHPGDQEKAWGQI